MALTFEQFKDEVRKKTIQYMGEGEKAADARLSEPDSQDIIERSYRNAQLVKKDKGDKTDKTVLQAARQAASCIYML